MPDRNLRERGIAVDGRIGMLEAKQRQMQNRVWQGAVRTAIGPPEMTPEEFDVFVAVLQLEARPGRWMVFGQADLVLHSPAEIADLRLRIGVFHPVTGVEITDGVDTAPRRNYALHSSNAIIPMSTMGDVVLEEVATVALMTMNYTAQTYLVQEARLKLMPV